MSGATVSFGMALLPVAPHGKARWRSAAYLGQPGLVCVVHGEGGDRDHDRLVRYLLHAPRLAWEGQARQPGSEGRGNQPTCSSSTDPSSWSAMSQSSLKASLLPNPSACLPLYLPASLLPSLLPASACLPVQCTVPACGSRSLKMSTAYVSGSGLHPQTQVTPADVRDSSAHRCSRSHGWLGGQWVLA